MAQNREKSTEKISNSTGDPCYEQFVKDYYERDPDYLIYLFLFDAQVAETIPWDTVREKEMYLKKYVFSIEDLSALNWSIVYDGE